MTFEWAIIGKNLPDGKVLYVTDLFGGRARLCYGDQFSVFDSW